MRATAEAALAQEGSGERFDHTVACYPVTGSMYYRFPDRLSFATPYLVGGIGFYYSRITFDNDISPPTHEAFVHTADLTAWRVDFQGGAGIEFRETSAVTIDLCVRGRLADVRGYSGSAAYYNGRTYDVFLARRVTGDAVIFEPQLTEYAGRYDEGAVDFSGFTFILALNVAL